MTIEFMYYMGFYGQHLRLGFYKHWSGDIIYNRTITLDLI